MTGGNDTKQQVTIIGWAWHNDTGGAQNEDETGKGSLKMTGQHH